MRRNSYSLRGVFLRALGFIFLLANVSYYVQYPGLLSASGVAPVDHLLPKLFPSIHRLLLQELDEDSFVELLVLIGIFFSTLAVW